MAAFDFSAGAGGMADALQEVLKQKFIEQIQKQKLAEDMRQADMQNALGQGQLALGNRRVDVDVDQFGQSLGQRDKEFGVQSGFKERELGMEEQMQPVRIAHTQAQTGDILRRPQAEQEERAFITGRDKTQHGYRLGEMGAEQAGAMRMLNARIAGEQGARPQPQAQADYGSERQTRILQSVDELDKKVSPWTTGAGSLLSYIPATDARNFNAELDSVKANIAFGELAEMRAASKTGGALGAVSERELALLESALGALDPGQSPANFKAQLQKIRQSIARWNQAKSGAGVPAQPPAGAQGGSGFRVVEIK